jgi:malonyl-CoA O-methyltransferase
MAVNAIEAYRIWAPQYDQTSNPLLALEMRILSTYPGAIGGRRVLDAGSGTGRWMRWAERRGARVFGIDACHEMLLESRLKPGLAGRSARADIQRIPMRDGAVDLAICSFTLGYVASIRPVFRELARVARHVIVSDLHPAAALHGWTRSFRTNGERYEVRHFQHAAAELDAAASAEGLTPAWRVETSFGEPERGIFRRAGKEGAFEEARRIPAVLITAWNKSSN